MLCSSYKDQDVKYIPGGSWCFPKKHTKSTLLTVKHVPIKQGHLTEHKIFLQL
jgi:hypothetical protein